MSRVARARTCTDRAPSSAAVERYVELFVARRDDFASPDGNGGWVRTGRPLTTADVSAGLSGGQSISTYSQDVDGRTHVLVVDFDVPDGVALARETALAMCDAGIPAYVEPSRQGRAHLVVTLDDRIRAAVARRFMRLALSAVGIDPSDPKIELFPASDRAPGPGQVGRCIRAPMMPNPKNGRRYPLLDPRSMERLGGTLEETVSAIVRGPAATVVKLAGPDPEPTRRAAGNTPPDIREFNETYTVSDVLRELWGVDHSEPGRSVLCPAHDDKHPSLWIFSDDRRVLCYSPTCVLNNDERGRDAYDLFVVAPSPVVRP